jgi:hypothetical protein
MAALIEKLSGSSKPAFQAREHGSRTLSPEPNVPTAAKNINDVHEILSSSAVMVRSAIPGCQGEKAPRTASTLRRERGIR